MLWKWCKRRHPNKGHKWIANKYWHAAKTRNWVFMDGDVRLINSGDIPIVRNIALKLDKNPFLDIEYFESRKRMMSQKKIKDYIQTTAASLF